MKWFIILMLPVCGWLAGCGTASHQPERLKERSCCTTNETATATHSERSLYQLESTWTNDRGEAHGLEALQGRVQVVVMFFASCNYACPILVHDMQRIEAALPDDLRSRVGFTLVTIDPERDTATALQTFRQSRALPENWTLLRSNQDDTLELAALLGVKFKREASGQFAHSNLITLLNQEGEIVFQLAGLNRDINDAVTRIRHELESNLPSPARN